jgi:nicotinamide mononucleotide adenylyltransferase
MSAFRCYLVSRLLWNPDINIDSTAQDFLNYYYGPAAPWIEKYIAGLNNYIRTNTILLTNYDNPYDHRKDYLSIEQLEAYKKIFANARAAVKGDELYLNRVEEAEQSLRYSILEVQNKSDNNSAHNDYYTSVLNEFRSVTAKNKVNALAESDNTVDSYYKEMTNYKNTKIVLGLAEAGAVKISYSQSNSSGM